MSKNQFGPKNAPSVPFGNLARKIVIEFDDNGRHRVTGFDYMVASGQNPESVTLISLPQPVPTDSRNIVLALVTATYVHLQAIFQVIGGKLSAETKTN